MSPRFLHASPSLLFLVLAACGGSVNGPSGGGGTGGGGDGTTGPDVTTPHTEPNINPDVHTLSLEGSFDLRFSSVVPTPDGNTYTPSIPPPSASTPFRLDVRRGATGELEGALTSRWGQIASAQITASATSLALAGNFTAGAGAGVQSVSDRWTAFTLDRAADGSLAGTFSATGEQTIFQGDVGYTLKLAGKGTLARDTTAPEARVDARSTLGPPGKLLPWDPLTFAFAEPIASADAYAAVHVAAAGGAPLPLAWDKTDADVTEWAGISSLVARAQKWPTDAAWTAIVEPVKDRVALGSARVASAIELLPIPGPTSSAGFDSDVLSASMWGSVELLGGGKSGATDAHCEAGGCARLTPPAIGSCSANTAGLLVQLTPGAARTVAVRYRVLAHPKYTGGTPYLPSVMVVESALEGGAPKRDHVYVGASNGPALSALGTAIDQYDWATPWSTFETSLPVGSGRVGVALTAVSDIYCGGPPLPPADVAVLIESISAK